MSQSETGSGPGASPENAGGEDETASVGVNAQTGTAVVPARKPPTLQQIADDWGTSVPYVSRCKNERGCPVDSLEAARQWRQEHQRGGVGYRSKKKSPDANAAGEGTENKLPPKKTPKRRSLKDMEASLRASIEIEEQAKFLVDKAIIEEKFEKLPLLIQAYNKAKEGRLESEKRLIEIREKARLLVPWDEARMIFARGWGTLLARLRKMPGSTGPKVNPQDDVTATEIIRADLEAAIADGQKTYEQVMA